MLFNSHIFLFAFLPVILLLWWCTQLPRRPRLFTLTAASYFFYGWACWWYCFLIFGSTVLDYVAVRRIHRCERAGTRKIWLVFSLAGNLGLLAVFKYLGFFAETINAFGGLITSGTGLVTVPSIALPIGISFYTFQSMSYTIDVYRGKVEPARDFIEFAAYVSMFPQLIAGPIVRYRDIAKQLRAVPWRFDSRKAALGIHFFVIGLGKKLLVADMLASGVNRLFAQWSAIQLVEAWLAALGYTLQIYFDFSAYSDMAVGLGLMLGFTLPQNFNSPYKARSIAEFWRRWHMTLSAWLRDFLYVSLGGNRGGLLLTVRNVAITMFLGGLWHGAAWTFVAWGCYHGVLLGIHHAGKGLGLAPRNAILCQALTFITVVFGWVLFRADSFEMARQVTWAMLGGHGVGPLPEARLGLLGMVVVGLMACFFLPNTFELRFVPNRWTAALYAALFLTCVLAVERPSPFLYFRF